MSIQLVRLYENTKDSYRLKPCGGMAGLENMVSWVHVLEDLKAIDFIRGSELILTTGMDGDHPDKEAWLLEFIRALASAGACGLVVNTGKYIDSLPPSVVNLCDDLRFPLLTMPWEIHLVDIVRDYCNRIFEANQSEESVTKAFRKAIFQPSDRDAYIPFLSARGYRPSAPYCVFTIYDKGSMLADKESAERFDTALRNKLNRLGKGYHLFHHEDILVIVFTDISGKTEAASISDAIGAMFIESFPGNDLRIGVGPVVGDIGRLSKTYKRATLALRFTELSGERSALFETMGLYRMLLSTDDTDLLREMLDENLGKLIRYDQKNKSDNMEILRLYIQNNFSVQQVGQQTFMHRNTINYRVRKIKEILGTDLECMDEKLKCLLAFYIYDML